jgi:diaminopimelate epimerase
MRFFKYQGIGNDFVLFDWRAEPRETTAELARRACDRRLGIGADGILALLPPRGDGDLRMSYRNADGSVAEMCGNGIRCVVLHAWSGAPSKREWAVETDAGLRRCTVFPPDGVEADMGRAEIGTTDEMPGRVAIVRVRTGNPHAVTFDPVPPEDRERIGRAIETHPSFPDRTNVEFVEMDGPSRLVVTVWERGVGFTKACGTGACAAAAAACASSRAAFDSPLTVTLPGGDLVVSVPKDLARVKMRGPAVKVFEGDAAL